MTAGKLNKQVSDYLLGNMRDAERDDFEERLLSDEALYYEVVEAENEMIDRYAGGELGGAERRSFERSWATFPGRREKVENARALRTFISEERVPEVESKGFFARLSALFASPFAAPAYAMAGMVLVLAVSLALLYTVNRERSEEVARLQGELANVSQAGLDRQLADSQRKIEELQSAIDSERDATGDLSADLAKERESRRRLEREIAALKNAGIPDSRPASEDPTVTVMRLDERSGPEAMLPDLGSERLSILISLPSSVKEDERVSIRLNGQEIARNVSVRAVGRGFQVNATVMTERLTAGENLVTVHDAAGTQIARYSIGGPAKEAQEKE